MIPSSLNNTLVSLYHSLHFQKVDVSSSNFGYRSPQYGLRYYVPHGKATLSHNCHVELLRVLKGHTLGQSQDQGERICQYNIIHPCNVFGNLSSLGWHPSVQTKRQF